MARGQMSLWGGPLELRLDASEALKTINARARDIERAQRSLAAAHREAGDIAAEQMARVLEEKVWARAARTGYSPRETGHLRRALRDRRNAPVGMRQIGAGNPEWLDRSPARLYWRNLNDGTNIFVGTPVFVFSGRASPFNTGIRDARNSPHQWRGTTVQRPIEGYHFMEEGADKAADVLAVNMRSIYRRHIPGFYRLFTEVAGGPGKTPPGPEAGTFRF